MPKKLKIVFLVILGIIISLLFLKNFSPVNKIGSLLIERAPFQDPLVYQVSSIPEKDTYLMLILGDSMEDALGPNANPLREYLLEYYPGHEFVNFNYGFGATNILSLSERLHSTTEYRGEKMPPALSLEFDLVILGSCAYNPLSEYTLEEGLKKQTEILDESIKEIKETHPDAVIIFLTPIAPSKDKFAEGVYDLSKKERQQWAEERIAYVENHIKFAKDNNIPIINVYEKSLTRNGKANLRYINPSDYIHPSTEGVDLIAKTIADFIYENEIYPR